jgi:hypothetical protein
MRQAMAQQLHMLVYVKLQLGDVRGRQHGFRDEYSHPANALDATINLAQQSTRDCYGKDQGIRELRPL